MEAMRVLLADEESALRAVLGRRLRSAGFAVDEVGHAAAVPVSLDVNLYRCVVLSFTLPHDDPITLVADMRRAGHSVPVLVLGSSNGPLESVPAFDAGADDFIARPFAIEELVARVRTLCRRADAQVVRPAIVKLGDLQLNTARREVTRNGWTLPLTPKEYAMLEQLSRQPGVVVSRADLIEQCWDEYADPMSNVIEVHMAALRRKMGAPQLIRTVRGAGYVLECEPDDR
jgi:two-component system copper resistance phosphate regulon response regulator CusR